MAFDAGSVDARLTLDTSAFDRSLDKARADVKRFEDEHHKVKIAAEFDQSSLTRARKAFSDLDNSVSKDAASRLQSSPQGSVLGSLNALFSPHPVSGAPTPAQAARQGLLGKMIGGPGDGGTQGGASPLAAALSQRYSTDNIRQALTGRSPGDVSTTDSIRQALTGQAPGDVITTDTIRRTVTGNAPGNTETTDTIKEKLDPASADKMAKDSGDAGDKAGKSFAARFGGSSFSVMGRDAGSTFDTMGRAGDRMSYDVFTRMRTRSEAAGASIRASLGGAFDSARVKALAAVNAIDPAKAGKNAAEGMKGVSPLIGAALALAPGTAVLGGVGLGAAGALGGSFLAGAGAIAAFGAVAKPVLTSALTAEKAVSAAHLAYTAAIAKGTGQSAAYKAEQVAITKAYGNMSPAQIALSRQLGKMSDAWTAVKKAETPVVAGALAPWLKTVTSLTGQLAPVIGAVAPVIGTLGGSMSGLVKSPDFAAFRDFIAGQGAYAVQQGGGTLIDFLHGFMILLPQFTPLIHDASTAVGDIGTKFLAWSKSKQASADIQGFMQWFRDNGPAVGGFLKSVGAALGTLLPGLTAGGALELKVLTGLLNFIAKLPKGLAGPLAETAGALLLLSKLGGGGIISFTVKTVLGAGKAILSKLLGLGGEAVTAEVGGAAMQTAADTMTAAAGAMQKAADTMTGAAAGEQKAGAEQDAAAGGEAAAGASMGSRFMGVVGPLLLAALAAGFAADWLKHHPVKIVDPQPGQPKTGNWWDNPGGSNPLSPKPQDQGLSTWAGLGNILQRPFIGTDTTGGDLVLKKLGLINTQISLIDAMKIAPGTDTTNVDGLLTALGVTVPSRIEAVNELHLKPGMDPVHVDALLQKIGLTPPQIAAIDQLVIKPKGDTSNVSAVQRAINSLTGKTVNVDILASGQGGVKVHGPTTSSYISFAPYFTAPGKAAGGKIPGFGGGDVLPFLLEPGEAVVDKDKTKRFASVLKAMGVPGFAGGGIAGWEGAAATTMGADAAGAMTGDIRAAIKAIGTAAAAGTPVNYHPGAGVTQWEGLVARALSMEGLAASLMQNVMIQIQSESGGNPNAINLTDSNAAAGDQSRGLLQTIMATFLAYHWPGTSGNIYDPLANIAAALNYARNRYGPSLMSGGMGIGSGHGYALGGPVNEPVIGWGVNSGQTYTFGENGPEWVTPGKGPPSGSGGTKLADTISLNLPEGTAVASALQELTWYLQTAKMRQVMP